MIPTTTMTIVSMEQVPEQCQVYEKCIDQERNQSSSEQGNLHSNNLIDLVRQQTPEYGRYII